MDIILVSSRMATAKTITVRPRHVVALLGALAAFILGMSSLFSLLTLRHAADIPLPLVQNLVWSLRAHEAQQTQEFLRENVNAMAARLGQLQAQLVRLDSLGERLAGFAGIKLQDLRQNEKPGQGGPLVLSPEPMSAEELGRQMEQLSRQLELHDDYLGLIESEVLDERVERHFLPTTAPVPGASDSSGYGYRSDPFTGQRAMHTGVDFQADAGEPIVAAAGGVVIAAESHPQYGNLVDVDHGNGLVTRYAHASRLLVKPGQIVKRGEKIGEVGSSGRSTGAHLHFEVRVNGAPQNPKRFLRLARERAPVLARRN